MIKGVGQGDVNGFRMKLDFRYNCATPIVIYVAICKHCDEPQTLTNFHFGKTINSTMNRCNGQRDCFKLNWAYAIFITLY